MSLKKEIIKILRRSPGLTVNEIMQELKRVNKFSQEYYTKDVAQQIRRYQEVRHETCLVKTKSGWRKLNKYYVRRAK